MPLLVVIGGPNGAGKTTAAMKLLPLFLRVWEFVNADEIARGLNPLNPDAVKIMAGKVVKTRIDSLIADGKDFAYETTCAGHHHLHVIKQALAAGYDVKLVFLWLPSALMAIRRVKQRAAQGGHVISEADITRRYTRGMNHISLLLPIDNAADKKVSQTRLLGLRIGLWILDASEPIGQENNLYPLIAQQINGEFSIIDYNKWLLFKKHTERQS